MSRSDSGSAPDPSGRCPRAAGGVGGHPADSAHHGAPMPPASAPAGPRSPSIVQAAFLFRAPVRYQQRQAHRFGDLFTLRLPPLGRLVVLADPNTALQAIRGDPATSRAGEANGRILPILDPGSLLLSDDEEHHRRRQVLMPAFHGANVTGLQDTARRATEQAMAGWPEGRPFRLLPSLQAITLEVILGAVIALPDPARATELTAAVRRMLGPLAGAAGPNRPTGVPRRFPRC